MIKTGIDISYANNTYSKIDFKQVKAATDFCIIRVGYRGYGDGTLKEDGWWKYNLNGCIERGIPFGVYFFTQAITEEEAKEEALFTLERLRGLEVDYPIYIDTEESGHSRPLAEQITLTLLHAQLALKHFVK